MVVMVVSEEVTGGTFSCPARDNFHYQNRVFHYFYICCFFQYYFKTHLKRFYLNVWKRDNREICNAYFSFHLTILHNSFGTVKFKYQPP